MLFGLVGLACGVLLALIVASLRPWARWKLRKIPGPEGWPLLGNLPEILSLDLPVFMDELAKKHGPVFKLWFCNVPFVCIADPDLARKVLYKLSWRGPIFDITSSATGEAHLMNYSSLFGAKGDVWRMGRRSAENSIINSTSLAGHIPVMKKCIDKLCARLERIARQTPAVAADSSTGKGEASAAGGLVDIFAEFGKMTLAVMGECGFGVDFRTLDDEHDDEQAAIDDAAPGQQGLAGGRDTARKLVWASRGWFDMVRADKAPIYLPIQMILPDAIPAVRWLAERFPTPTQTLANVYTQTIVDVTKELIGMWSTAKLQGTANAVSGSSFLSTLLEERRAAGGEERKLTDLQVISNAFVFILAGYETTASLLGFALFDMTTQPGVQARIQAEVDAWGRDKPINTVEDIAQFPYTEAMLRESLRMHSPATGAVRYTADGDLDLGSYRIPKGTSMFIHSYGLEKDPAYWADPKSFMPERFLPGGEALGPNNPNAFIPFGGGSRMCPGHRFAIMEAKLTLILLAQRFSFSLDTKTAERLQAGGRLRSKTGITHAPSEGVWVNVSERL